VNGFVVNNICFPNFNSQPRKFSGEIGDLSIARTCQLRKLERYIGDNRRRAQPCACIETLEASAEPITRTDQRFKTFPIT